MFLLTIIPPHPAQSGTDNLDAGGRGYAQGEQETQWLGQDWALHDGALKCGLSSQTGGEMKAWAPHELCLWDVCPAAVKMQLLSESIRGSEHGILFLQWQTQREEKGFLESICKIRHFPSFSLKWGICCRESARICQRPALLPVVGLPPVTTAPWSLQTIFFCRSLLVTNEN